MTDNKKTGVAIIGAITGIVLASLKRREIVQFVDALHIAAPAKPSELSRADWKEVLFAVQRSLASKNLPTLAAGVAYYSVLAFFPFLAAIVAISALLITPIQLNTLVSTAEAYLPPDIATILSTQLQNLVDQRSGNVVIAVIGLGIALFGASGTAKSLIIASNAAYGVRETRGWLTQQIWGIVWTVAGIIFGLIVLALLAANGSILEYIALPAPVVSVILYSRWVLAVALTVFGLAVFYRYGPDRPVVGWRWVSWGATIATLTWLVATTAFFTYVQHFANYTQSYSLFAGIIVLMIWLNLSALIALVGVEINVQLEKICHQKSR